MKNIKKLNPKISIVTVCLNSVKTIERTIQSVLSQSYENIEYIIIDGGSTDGTLDIVNKYKDKVSFLISERDKGIYDAFNKGLKVFTGELIGFVNSDDYLLPDAMNILSEYFNRYSKKDFFFGSVKKHWGILHGYKPWKIFLSWGFYSSHSTGFFIKKDAAKIVGSYNLKYKYSADYDYFYRMIIKHRLKGIGTKKSEVFGVFNRGGFSSQVNFFDHMCECTKIRLDNRQNKLVVLISFITKYMFNYKKLK